MNYLNVQFFLVAAVVVFLAIAGKRLNKKVERNIMVMAILFFFLPNYLPRQIFGRWNSMSALDDKVISEIRLQPSSPDWKVNLVGGDFIISDKQQIDTITQFLKHANVYFPSHPMRIWETKMMLITTTRDTFEIEVHKTSNNGTTFETPTNRWRKDEMAAYLEQITKHREPVYSDTSTNRN